MKIDLGAEEWRLLEQLVATVLPSDDQPGAIEADVMGFLRRAFDTGRWSAQRELFTSGLRTLDMLARRRCGSPFASCTAADRDAIVSEFLNIPHPRASGFLRLLVDMTLAGFLCAPRHGGNRERIGWTLVGWQPIEPRCPETRGM